MQRGPKEVTFGFTFRLEKYLKDRNSVKPTKILHRWRLEISSVLIEECIYFEQIERMCDWWAKIEDIFVSRFEVTFATAVEGG